MCVGKCFWVCVCVFLQRLTCEVRRTINTIDGLYSVILVGYKIAPVGNTEQKKENKGVPHKSMFVCVCACVRVCSLSQSRM